MAEHLRNELARANIPVRPNRIAPLALTVGQVADLPSAVIIRDTIILDGFFTLSEAELDFIEKLATQTQVTVTLPDWPGSADAREHLRSIGFTEQHLDTTLRHPTRNVFAALTLEQEVEQISLRILEHTAKGREFREMGVLLRVRDPYASALESIFARLGIPARFHFADALSSHPAIQYLTGLIRAKNPADFLTLLRMPISGLGATPEGDRQDFAMREALPGGAASRPALRITETDLLAPSDWAKSLKTLRHQIPIPEITDQIDRDQLNIYRSTAAALNAFDRVLDTVAQALTGEMDLPTFWSSVETILVIEKLRIPDRRRNIVHVLDIYEAGHWEFPIAFVCGLNERHFPHEDRFLFDLATTRATEETILSYARFNEKGDPQLRSFFLAEQGEPPSPTRILPVGQVSRPAQVPDFVSSNPRSLTPTSIETFLQCPFQFFAQRTLKLRKRPDKPRDRLNALVQGSILHRALAEGELDRVFNDECQKNNIPRTYRTEAVRLELKRHFEAFRSNENWPLNWPSQVEQKFELALTPELSISGRIDRLDLGPNNEAIVIDYKYSAAAKLRERVESDPVQAGLYLLAAERVFNLKPAGMFYCGLRQSVSWEGWHTNVPGLKLGEARTSLRELIEAAEKTSIAVFESIRSGNKEVRPTDRNKCRYCDFNAVCRIESISQADRRAILAPGSWLLASSSDDSL